MYKVMLILKSGIIELYIDNILKLGEIILEHDDYTGCFVQRIEKEENTKNKKKG